MKNKFKFLISNSLKKKMKTKWFLVTHIFLFLAIIALVNIDNLIKTFGGDFNEDSTIHVIDNASSFDEFKLLMENSFTLTGEEGFEIVLTDKTEEELTNEIKENESSDLILILNTTDNDVLVPKMISNDFSNMLDLSAITSSLNQIKTILAIEKYDLSEEEILALTVPVELERIILNEDASSTEENMEMIMSTLFPIIILPFFMLSIILVQMIGAEVNDEKVTRGMEIIISNVSPGVHLTAKVVSATIFVVSQAVLLFLYAVIGLLLRGLFANDMGAVGDLYNQVQPFLSSIFTVDMLNQFYMMIPILLILMLLTLVAYAILAAVLASVTTNAEDFQQLQAPLVIISLAGYYLAIMSGMFEGSLFIQIAGYIPFISAILSPSLFITGDFGIIDLSISLGILAIFVYFLIRYGLKIYKVGILNYSSKNLWKKMFKALKS